MRSQAVFEAKTITRKHGSGVLSTISKNLRGYPFGSVSPYFMATDGSLYFYVSDIAQHAKNLAADSRMSMTIYRQAESGDQNEQGRVTIVGDAKQLSDEQQQRWLAQYLGYFPDAESYSQAHDFNIWKMDVIRVRYIGGFGKIFWIEANEWLLETQPWEEAQEHGMIEHMNQDHLDAMQAMLLAHYAVESEAPVMVGANPEGCTIQDQGRNYYFAYTKVCQDTKDARMELVRLTKQARKNLASQM